MRLIKNKAITILTILILGCFFIFSLSPYVQGGDTAELVLAAKNLYLPHPSGYPLYIWLNHFFISFINIKTLFWSASLFQSLIALTTLTLLLFRFSKNMVKALAIIAILFFNISFFETAILPDVFSLNSLMMTLVFYFLIEAEFKSENFILYLPFPFILGFANHLTMIFLLPLYLYGFQKVIAQKKLYPDFLKKYLMNTFITLILLSLIYASIFFFHQENYYSWGNVHSLKTLVNHFLRKDYGVFSLAPNQQAGFFNLDACIFFLNENCVSLFLATLLLFQYSKLFKQNLKLIFAICLTIFFSFLFFGFAHFPIANMGEEIVRRFHSIAIVLISNFICYLFVLSLKQNSSLKKEINMPVLLVSIAAILIQFPKILNYHKQANDNIFEKFYLNTLSIAHQKKIKYIMADDDNLYFGLKYFAHENPIYQDITVLSPTLFFHPWYQEKIKERDSHFILKNAEKISTTKTMNLEDDLIIPNIKSSAFLFIKNYQGSDFNLEFYPIGRSISNVPLANKEIDFQIDRGNFENIGPAQNYSKMNLYSQYTDYYLNLAKVAYLNNKIDLAITNWNIALKIFPYAIPALDNLCKLDIHYKDCAKLNDPNYISKALTFYRLPSHALK